MVAGAETSRYSSSYKHMVLGWNSGTEYLFSVNSRSDVNWIVFQLNDDTDTVSTYDDAGTLQNKFDDNLFYAVGTPAVLACGIGGGRGEVGSGCGVSGFFATFSLRLFK